MLLNWVVQYFIFLEVLLLYLPYTVAMPVTPATGSLFERSAVAYSGHDGYGYSLSKRVANSLAIALIATAVIGGLLYLIFRVRSWSRNRRNAVSQRAVPSFLRSRPMAGTMVVVSESTLSDVAKNPQAYSPPINHAVPHYIAITPQPIPPPPPSYYPPGSSGTRA